MCDSPRGPGSTRVGPASPGGYSGIRPPNPDRVGHVVIGLSGSGPILRPFATPHQPSTRVWSWSETGLPQSGLDHTNPSWTSPDFMPFVSIVGENNSKLDVRLVGLRTILMGRVGHWSACRAQKSSSRRRACERLQPCKKRCAFEQS